MLLLLAFESVLLVTIESIAAIHVFFAHCALFKALDFAFPSNMCFCAALEPMGVLSIVFAAPMCKVASFTDTDALLTLTIVAASESIILTAIVI